jgi:hypothetical protein
LRLGRWAEPKPVLRADRDSDRDREVRRRTPLGHIGRGTEGKRPLETGRRTRRTGARHGTAASRVADGLQACTPKERGTELVIASALDLAGLNGQADGYALNGAPVLVGERSLDIEGRRHRVRGSAKAAYTASPIVSKMPPPCAWTSCSKIW